MSSAEGAIVAGIERLGRRVSATLETWSDHKVFGPAVRFGSRRREQILYLVVGGWNTLFGYVMWATMQYLLGDHIYYLVILLLAWFPAVLNAYFCYRYFVFCSRGKIRWELPRFASVYVVTLCINLVALPILLRMLPFNIYVTQILFTFAVVVLSYLSHKYFSFRSGHSSPAAPQVVTAAADESSDQANDDSPPAASRAV